MESGKYDASSSSEIDLSCGYSILPALHLIHLPRFYARVDEWITEPRKVSSHLFV